MNFRELLEAFAERNGLSQRAARRLYDSLTDIITERLEAGEEVYLGPAIGRLYTRRYGPTERKMPHSGEVIRMPDRTRVRFRASHRLNERVSKAH